MRPSGPRDPKAPSVADPKAPRSADPRTLRGAEGFGDDPHVERSDDRSTLEIRGGAANVMASEDEDEDVDARETAPPPLPVAQYVRTMMKQVEADEAPVSEPPPSRAPLSYRGEPRTPLSFRPRGPMDSTPTVTSMRAVDLAAEMNSLEPDDEPRARVGLVSATSRGLREDDEFERRPLSLRNDEGPRAPAEPWRSTARPPAPSAPAPALERRSGGDSDASLARSQLRGASLTAPAPRAPPVPPLPPKRSLTPAGGSRPLAGPPQRKPSSSGMPAVSGNRPLPPPPVPKGPPPNPTPTALPRSYTPGRLMKSATSAPPRPESDAVTSAELDALSLDDLMAAAERSAPPPTIVPQPAKPPLPAGLRLGKEPLSSFPAPIEAPDEAGEDAVIPPILDVAWASSDLDDEPTYSDGDRLPFLPGLAAEPVSAEPDDAIPAILDVGWAFPQGAHEGYTESDEVTSVGVPEDELAHEDELGARLAEGDYEGVLVLAERLLESDPCDARALRAAEAARERLVEASWEALGGRRRVPFVTMAPEDIRWLSLDHRAGFLLSCIDGRISLEEVLDVATMPELDALRLIGELHAGGVISFDPPGARSGRR